MNDEQWTRELLYLTALGTGGKSFMRRDQKGHYMGGAARKLALLWDDEDMNVALVAIR